MIWTRDGSAAWIGHPGGLVFRSVDGGATWTQRSTGIGTQLILLRHRSSSKWTR